VGGDQGSDNGSLIEQFGGDKGDLNADDNILEVWIVDAELDPNFVRSEAARFCIVDFFDYESQTTPLLSGVRPAFNFASTYKVTVDDFFMRHLCSDSVIVEARFVRSFLSYLRLGLAWLGLACLGLPCLDLSCLVLSCLALPCLALP
jgi:hypothetical protein